MKARLLDLVPSETIILVGAGLCVDLNYPSWTKLIEMFADAIEKDCPLCAQMMKDRLQRGQIIAAADPAYLLEVRPETRARFLTRCFGNIPELKRRHRLLGQLPVAAFVTTNFDLMLESAIGAIELDKRSRTATVFNGADRFQRFNSSLGLYREDFERLSKQRALVLKIHNDISDLEHIVLTTSHFEKLPNHPGFNAFYQTSFRSYNVIIIGFSANDPSLLSILAEEIGNYAGFCAKTSYLIVPDGTLIPESLKVHPLLQSIFYDSAGNHQQLEDLLKELGDRWLAPKEDRRIIVSEQAPENDAPLASIFELMVPAIQSNVDETIAHSLGRHMVTAARRIAAPHNDVASIANRLSQKYGLSTSLARNLVTAHPESPSIQTSLELAATVDPARILANGLLSRALSYDQALQLKIENIVPIVKSILEKAMAAFGGNVALTIIHLDIPWPDVFKKEVKVGLGKRWPGVGDVEREALELAFGDLFLNPDEAEERTISSLAITAIAFALIQSFPESSLQSEILPDIVYFDANLALPLLTRTDHRYNNIRELIQFVNTGKRPVTILRVFLNEVAANYDIAITKLREYQLNTVADVDTYITNSSDPIEFINVFLLMITRVNAERSDKAEKVLRHYFGDGQADKFGNQLELAGLQISDAEGVPDRESVFRHYILLNKKETYNRSLKTRTILARHEARQLSVMEFDVQRGRRPWFVTEDRQLRVMVREAGGLTNITLLALLSARGLAASVTNGAQYSGAFSRLMWDPNWHDQSDIVVSAAIRRILPSVDVNVRIPVEEAKRFATEELRRRHSEEKEVGSTSGTFAVPPPESNSVVDSVYKFLGERLRSKAEK